MKRDFLFAFAAVTIFMFTFVSIAESASADGDFWVTRAPMPTSASNFGTVTVGGKIYAVGSDFTYMFDPPTDTWVSKTAMPTARICFAVAACEGKIYVIGGSSGVNANTGISVASQINEMYDTATDTWTSKPAMPVAAMNLQASVVGSKIYLISGMADPETPILSNATWIYDTQSDSWSKGADIPNPVFSYASAAVGNKIYVEGGAFSGTPFFSNLNQIYNTETNTWSLGKPLPVPVYKAAAGATIGELAPVKLYVIGGTDGGCRGFKEIQIYDPETETWTLGTAMPTARLSLAVAVLNDCLYALGGISWSGPQNNVGPAYAVNEEYIPLNYAGPIPSMYVPTPSLHPTEMPSSTASSYSAQSTTTPNPTATVQQADSSVKPAQTTPTAELALTVAVAVTLTVIIFVALSSKRLSRR